MANIWGKPIGKDGKHINYKDTKPAHVPRVLNPDGSVFQQPSEQQTSNMVGDTSQTSQGQQQNRPSYIGRKQ